jgi:heme/copper-type cytochrome/quinol oxidase subunit 2
MISKRIKSTLRLSNSSNDTGSLKEKNEEQNLGKILPTYAIILITISCAVLLLALIYLLYHKYKKNHSSKNIKPRHNEPIREVWANPEIDITNNIITFDETNSSNKLYFKGLNQNTEILNISKK